MSEYGNPRLVRVMLVEDQRNARGRSYESMRWGAVDPNAVILSRQIDGRQCGRTVELKLVTGATIEVRGALNDWWQRYDVEGEGQADEA